MTNPYDSPKAKNNVLLVKNTKKPPNKYRNCLGGLLVCGGFLLGLYTLMAIFLLIGMAPGIEKIGALGLSKEIFISIGLCGVFSTISLVVGVNLRAKKDKSLSKSNEET